MQNVCIVLLRKVHKQLNSHVCRVRLQGGRAVTPTSPRLNGAEGREGIQRWDLDATAQYVWPVLVTFPSVLVEGEAHLHHLVAHPAQDRSHFSGCVPQSPEAHSASPGTAPLGAECCSPTTHPHVYSDAADSSPAPGETPSMRVQHSLHAGNCETAHLLKTGLVMSFLATDPGMCQCRSTTQHSSSCCSFCQLRCCRA